MTFLNKSEIEILNSELDRGNIRFAVFDFDGTVSLVREGWQAIMIPMMVSILLETGTDEPRRDLETTVEDFVGRLTGKQTIYQMIRLAEEVAKRGSEPLEPLAYKHRYNDLLWDRIKGRVAGLKDGSLDPRSMMVPSVDRMLELLRDHGITLILASGTDLPYVQDEAAALGVAGYFDGGIFGALDQHENFSKQMVLNEIMTSRQLSGPELLVLGDGYVEIEEGRRVGGIAVGVASDEARRTGIDAWKRTRLIEAGADIVISDFREWDRLGQYLLSR